MAQGTIKPLKSGVSYGFIAPEEGDSDIFFHESSLVGVSLSELQGGEHVTFDVENTEKGKAATNVKVD